MATEEIVASYDDALSLLQGFVGREVEVSAGPGLNAGLRVSGVLARADAAEDVDGHEALEFVLDVGAAGSEPRFTLPRVAFERAFYDEKWPALGMFLTGGWGSTLILVMAKEATG